jgi:carboxypeptidase Taq
MATAWSEYTTRIAELEAINGATGVLSWDQQTKMPPGAAGHRSEQLSALAAIFHERMTHPRLGELLSELTESEDPVQRAAARRVNRRYQRATKVPAALVTAMSKAQSEGFSAWMRAREANEFAPFSSALKDLVRLSRETAAAIGYDDHPYDALLEEYDPGSTSASLAPMFARLEAELVPFVRDIGARPGPAKLDMHMSADALRQVNGRLLDALGFRADDGRLDESQHPFTIGIGPHDVRLTTHLYEDDVLSTLGGTIHECGHGLYEQGIPDSLLATGLGEAAGIGLHESQSRFWENVIGRSEAFCHWLTPVLLEASPDLDIDPARLYAASNRVTPSLIRIKADEVTYNLHILVRFRLELALIGGTLSVDDLPEAWDAAYGRDLGGRPPDPVQGVLQDVHWSSAYFGYFPSYTIGNLYAASFRAKIEEDIPDLWTQVAAGDFAPTLAWLRKNVHERGALVDAPEVFADAVGERDPVADLMNHLRSRHGALYGVG